MAGQRGRPQSITYESMAQDLITDLDVADAVCKVFFDNDDNLMKLMALGYSVEQARRVMSGVGVQATWRARVSGMNRLHKRLVMTTHGRTEQDHAVPLDAIRSYVRDHKLCWVGTHQELVQFTAQVLERCLIKIRVAHAEHAALNVDYKFIMPSGHEDLMTCDVLARYAAVFPDRIQELRDQLITETAVS